MLKQVRHTSTTCAVANCERDRRWGLYCVAHGERVRKYGDPLPDVPIRKKTGSIIKALPRGTYRFIWKPGHPLAHADGYAIPPLRRCRAFTVGAHVMTDDRSTRVFLAGPMAGCIEWNFPAFDETARSLRRDGFEVFSPAERDRDAGFDPTGLDGTEDLEALGFDLREAMKANLAWICDHADAVALLDGWEQSRGAIAEVALAQALSLPMMRRSAPSENSAS